MGAQKTVQWDSDVDRLELAFDGAPIDVLTEAGAAWRCAAVPGLTVTRTAAANGVRVQLEGVFDVVANAVPITEEDSRVHNYGVTEDDSLAHHGSIHRRRARRARADLPHRLREPAQRQLQHAGHGWGAQVDYAVARFKLGAGGNSMVTARAY